MGLHEKLKRFPILTKAVAAPGRSRKVSGKAARLGLKGPFALSSFILAYPVLAEMILARNVVNSPEVDAFVKGFHVEDMQAVNEWLDTTIRKFIINKYDNVKRYSPKEGDPDWMKGKTDLEAVVLDNALAQKIQHVVDFLKNKLTAEPNFKLGAFQAEEALKQSQAWSEKLKKKKSEEEVEGTDYEVLMDLGDGWKWIKLTSQNSLSREGNKMGHCVGGYWERVKKGLEQIFSLRDGKNEPHATIEYRKGSVDQIKGKQNRGVIKDYMPYVLKFLENPPVQIRKVAEHDLQLNGLVKAKKGYLSLQNLPDGAVVDQDLDLRTMEAELPKNLTVNGDLKIKLSDEIATATNLTVLGELTLFSGSKYNTVKLPSGLKVGSLNIFRCAIEELPADIQIKKDLNAEFSQLQKIPPLKLSGDLTISDTEITELPAGLKVGGELDIMNTQITRLPKDLKVGVAIFVDDPDDEDAIEVPEKLKALIH